MSESVISLLRRAVVNVSVWEEEVADIWPIRAEGECSPMQLLGNQKEREGGGRLRGIRRSKYIARFIATLDNPEELWRHADRPRRATPTVEFLKRCLAGRVLES